MIARLTHPAATSKARAALLLEEFVLCFIMVVATLDWLGQLHLSPDSAGYISAARNLLKTGHLYSFVSVTDFRSDPRIVPYIDTPPGFPVLLVPFLAVFGDPLISALIAQCVYIVLFYLFVYWMTLRLGFSPLLRIVALILFTFVAPFRSIHNTYWTETLFIALSIGAGLFAIELLADATRAKTWLSFIVVVALSGLVRYTGVANLAWIAPFFLTKDALRAVWRLLTHRRTLAGLCVGGGLLIVLSLLADLLPIAKPGIGPMQWRGIVLGAAALIVGLAGLLSWRHRPSKSNSEDQVLEAHLNRLDNSTWVLLSLLATVGPILAWLVRNRLVYDVVSNWLVRANGSFPAFQFNRFGVPFQYIWNELLDFRIVPRPLVAILAIGLLVVPLLRLPVFGMAGSRKVAQTVILWAAGVHFVLVWFLSFVTRNEPIGGRYFSPILGLLFLGMLNGLQQVSESFRPGVWRQSFLAVPLVLLLLSGSFPPSGLIQGIGKVNFPRERQLWREIDGIAWTHSSSFFYSDSGYGMLGYLHEIFSGKPQGVIHSKIATLTPGNVERILSRGINPFILVIESGPEARTLDGMVASESIPLEKISFPDVGFVLYRLGE